MSSQANRNTQTQPVDLAGSLIGLAQDQPSTLPNPLLEQVRSRAISSSGATTTLKERWKYTPAKRFFQAMLDHQQSMADQAQRSIELAALPSGCSWQALDEDGAGDSHSAAVALLQDDSLWQRYPLADVISQSSNAGYCLDIQETQSETLTLKLNPGVGFLLVRLGANVSATVSIEYAPGSDFAGHWIASALAPGAQLNQALLINSDADSTHRWLLNHVDLDTSSQFNGHVHAFAESSQRLETHLRLQGQGAEANLTSASITAKGSSFDHQVVMEHQAPNCESKQRVHNIADGGSKNSFNGRIHILPGAHNTNAQLQNRNLAIAAGAEINTKPELEIYNDNVSCSHGATIGQLDEQALFYLRSRGVPPAQGRDLLLRAFIAQCYGGALAEQVQDAADRLLNGALRR